MIAPPHINQTCKDMERMLRLQEVSTIRRTGEGHVWLERYCPIAEKVVIGIYAESMDKVEGEVIIEMMKKFLECRNYQVVEAESIVLQRLGIIRISIQVKVS